MGDKNKYVEDDYKNKCADLGLIYLGYHFEEHHGLTIDFLCEKHKDRGMQSASWSHFKTSKIGCPYCYGRNKTTEEVKEELEEKNIELLSEYNKCEAPIVCKCRICGYEWETKFHYVMRKGRGCPNCGLERKKISKLKSTEQFKEDLKKVNKDIDILGEYIGTHKKILCQCKICGTIWETYPANLLNKSSGCPYCSISMGEKTLLNTLSELGINYVAQYPISDGKHKKPLRYDAYNIENNIAFEYNGQQHYYPVDFAGKGDEWARDQLIICQERDKSKMEYSKNHNINVIIVPYWEEKNMKDYIQSQLKEMNLKLVS